MPLDTKGESQFDKSKLPSRHVSVGPASAPHRSYYYAMGLSGEQIHQPFVGVATCWNEAAPCNISLMRQAQAVKEGVVAASGTPREFCTITVTDGIAMGHEGMRSSLASREAIADTVELTMRGLAAFELPALDLGMTNVTAGVPGVRMGPAGMRFVQPVELSLGYDPELLPAGMGADDVRTFYFDEEAGRWYPVPRRRRHGDDS